MELTANVWPVFDETGLVLRFFMRAYAMEAPDEVISATLQALAPTDFRIAPVYPIPRRFAVVSPYGALQGCVTIGAFHEDQSAILASAFKNIEKSFTTLQGVATNGPQGDPVGVGVIPRFPANPYLLITSLLETPAGQLIPQIRA
jgi:hypothetical protein